MPNYQQFQKYKPGSEKKGYRYGRAAVILGVAFILFLIVKSVFSSSSEINISTPENNLNINMLANQSVSSNTNSGTNINAGNSNNINTAQIGNTNIINADISSDLSEVIDISICNQAFSYGPTSDKKVSLTFNVGTSKEGKIQGVIDELKDASVRAAFFARGDISEDSPDLISKISKAGFPVYNLSYSHPHFNSLSSSEIREQLDKAEVAISKVSKNTTKPFFRPPYGEANADVVAEAKAAGYCTITWSVDAMDWSSDYTPEQSKQRILDNVKPGTIILMQAANAITYQILPEVISSLKKLGYQILPLEELFN